MSDTPGVNNMLYEEINPQAVTEADIAVIIPSYKEADNIALPARKAGLGLANYFPNFRCVVINCDNNSPDGTKEAFLGAEFETPRIYLSTPPGVVGKGANMRNGFDKASSLGVKAVAVIGANLLSIRTRWMWSLLAPIIEGGAEFVAPLYARHKYDSPISKGLAYPFGRALFGRRVLQPISIDMAFSSRLLEIYRQQDWPLEDKGYYMDMHMLYLAIVNQAPICQSYMAHPRVTASSQSDDILSASFRNVVENLFDLMIISEDFWKNVSRSRPTSLAGIEEGQMKLPPQVEVDKEQLISQFVRYSEKTRELWPSIFGPELAAKLEEQLAVCSTGGCPTIDIELWRPAIFNAALAYKKAAPEDRRAIASSLVPLFFGKGLDSYLKGRDLDDRQFHAMLEEEARTFEAAKKDFIARWDE
ncbi:glycosyl transferase [Deltaproteobacteria bacterium Smac51]|nr:glycosyl transferase [Deltaproteobacteria bacterium Smac51]